MEKLDLIVKALEDKIAEDIITLDLREKSSISEYFVIATGSAINHNQAICDEVQKQLREHNYEILNTEGYTEGSWILCDYGDVIVHIMTKNAREYYNLERLWNK